MTNDQDKELGKTKNQAVANDVEKGFEVTNQGQNLGGKGERKIDVGETNDEDDFSKTDQSITQAAPGQTANGTNQGSSNI